MKKKKANPYIVNIVVIFIRGGALVLLALLGLLLLLPLLPGLFGFLLLAVLLLLLLLLGLLFLGRLLLLRRGFLLVVPGRRSPLLYFLGL